MAELNILYEDNHLIAVNKTVHDIVQGDKTGDEPLSDKVKAYIKRKYNKPGEVYLGVVHRLDRPASGVVIFARTSKALARMNRLFQDKEVKKTYWAITHNRPPHEEEELIHYMIKNQEKNRSSAYDREKKGTKKAVLSYKLIGATTNYNLLEVNLKTGRHHQIRCQLAKNGCPIKGDLKYGAPRSNKGGGICLHARKIEFIHPVSKEPVTIIAKPPMEDNLWKEFAAMAD